MCGYHSLFIPISLDRYMDKVQRLNNFVVCDHFLGAILVSIGISYKLIHFLNDEVDKSSVNFSVAISILLHMDLVLET